MLPITAFKDNHFSQFHLLSGHIYGLQEEVFPQIFVKFVFWTKSEGYGQDR